MVGIYVMATALARMPLEKLGSAFEPVAFGVQKHRLPCPPGRHADATQSEPPVAISSAPTHGLP